MLNKLSLYFHTIRYLTYTQVKYRIYYLIRGKVRRFLPPSYFNKDFNGTVQNLNLEPSLPTVSSIKYQNSTFSFLNLEKKFEARIDWNEACHAKLWTYNLTYFEFLHIPNMEKEEGLKLIHDFIKNINTVKDGLEPYPISLRVIHTIKFLIYNNIQDEVINQSLYQQFWILVDKREYHILGNHLLENGFGLLFGAYYFNNEKLYKIAKSILIKELEEQILKDGGHFELSPMYHQLMLYRVLDCYNLIKNNDLFNQELLSVFESKASIMLGWLNQMTFKNGDIPLLNDSAFNINPKTKQLLQYAEQLEILPYQKTLKESGYRRYEQGYYEVIVDMSKIGPDYLPGHAHNDIFSFVLYHRRQPIIIDTGTSTYNSGERRNIERSTHSHNTVSVANYEQAQIWGSFRVAKRPHPQIIEEQENSIKGTFTHATIDLNHTRQFISAKETLEIIDKLDKEELAIAHFHIHPNVNVSISKNNVVLNNIKMNFDGALNIELQDFEYAPEFNKNITAQKLMISFKRNLKTTFYF